MIAVLVIGLGVGISLVQMKTSQKGKAAGIAPYQKVFTQLSPAYNYLKWVDWYPVDYGQPKGYRMLNWWSSGQGKVYGNSYFHVLYKPGTLPGSYRGNQVDYFYIWSCLNPWNGTDRCYDAYYKEIISQGTAVDTVGKTTLEHWARGDSSSWEVYYNPTFFGWGNCTASYIRAHYNQAGLEQEMNKQPMTLKLPDAANTYSVSDPVCALVFNGWYQIPTNLRDIRDPVYSSSSSPVWWTGDWIVVTINHDKFTDNQGFSIVRAENIYMTDNFTAAAKFDQEYCQNLKNVWKFTDTLHCTGDGSKGLTIVKDNRTYKEFAYEEYWMRKTGSSGKVKNPFTGQPVRDLYGFGSFRWYATMPLLNNSWDQIKNDGTKSTDNGAGNQVFTMEKCNTDQYNNIASCGN